MLARPRPALLTAFRGGYGRAGLLADLGAGLLVGVVALPLSMALAIASGCRPEQGLYTAIIGGAIVAVLGGGRYQVAGPAGAFVGLCAAGVNQFGYAGLALATLISGGLLLFMGLMRLGKAISYVPTPVIVGFTSGIAVTIASDQIIAAFGLPGPAKPFELFHQRVLHIAAHIGAFNWRALAVCTATVALIVVFRRLAPRLPGALIAIVAVTGAVVLLGWEGDGPGRVNSVFTRFQHIPHSLPAPSFEFLRLPAPPPDAPPPPGGSLLATIGAGIEALRPLLGLAGKLAILGAIESLLCAVVADGLSGDRHDSDSELIAQGAANLAVPFFLGMPVTAVIARTSTGIRAGARTPIAALVHCATLLAIMLVAAPLVEHVPLACLAGVLLVVCWSMAELRHWPHILRAGRGDAFLLPLAFGLTVFLDLAVAIGVGVPLALLVFVRRMSEATEVEAVAETSSERLLGGRKLPSGVEVYEVRGPFFFGIAALVRDLLDQIEVRPKVMVLRLRHVPFIDATAAFALRDLLAGCRREGIELVLSEVRERPRATLAGTGLLAEIGEQRVFSDGAAAIAFAAAAAEGVAAARSSGRRPLPT